MNCPVCNVTLLMSEKQWIEIDYCPQCRWIWLDRWELEKLIEKSTNTNSSPIQSTPTNQYHTNQNDNYHHKHKKESFLSELFDF